MRTIKLAILTFFFFNLFQFNSIVKASEAKEQLEQLKQNTDNSKSNFDLWTQNNKIASDNLSELEKARDEHKKKLSEWKALDSQFFSQVSKIREEDKLFNEKLSNENKKLKEEEIKIKELESLVLQLQNNIQKRKENLALSQQTKNEIIQIKDTLEKQKKEHDDIGKKMQKFDSNLTAQITAWKARKTESARNMEKWKQLTEYHSKLLKTYNRLSEKSE